MNELFDVWKTVFVISGWIVAGVAGCYYLHELKVWVGNKLDRLVK